MGDYIIYADVMKSDNNTTKETKTLQYYGMMTYF